MIHTENKTIGIQHNFLLILKIMGFSKYPEGIYRNGKRIITKKSIMSCFIFLVTYLKKIKNFQSIFFVNSS